MKTFKGYISEARIYEPKYKAGTEFTLNERDPNAVHNALFNANYATGAPFKKSDEDATKEYGDPKARNAISVTLEDEKGSIIKVWGSKSALKSAFNQGTSAGGGKMYAADWEEVITIAHNRMLDSDIDIDEAAVMGEIKLPVKKKIVSKINEPGLTTNLLNGVVSSLPNDVMVHYGRKTGTASTLWKNTFKDAEIDMNPKSMTPKTDMKVGTMNISLKKSGGSQLMSGYKGDTMGVITAAYNKAWSEDSTMRQNTVAQLKRDFDTMYSDVKTNFESAMDVGQGSRDIRKKAASGATLTKLEKSVMEVVKKGVQVQETIRGILQNSPRVKYYAVEEAMTGNMKFSDADPKSNYLMVFSPEGPSHIDQINDKIINEYVSKVTWSVGLKSASQRGALSLRAIVKDEYEPTSTMKQIISEAWDEIGEDRIYLSEGLWDKIKDKASDAANWAKEKGLKILRILWDKIVSKIIALLQKGFVWIKRIFGFQPVLKSVSNPYFV